MMKKRLKTSLSEQNILLVFTCALLTMSWGPAFAYPAAQSKSHYGITPTAIKAPSGSAYRLFPQGKSAFDFVVSRPTMRSKRVLLCVPAAFTMHDGTVDGVCIVCGVSGRNEVNKELGGAMIVDRGRCRLLSTNKGAALTKSFVNSIKTKKASLFQQFLIVQNGRPASFRDQSNFQRRAICENRQGAFSLIESEEPITFKTFNTDLAAMGMLNALYLDMGAWDEGWYRDAASGAIVKIGLDRSRTGSQSNWLILK